MSLLGQVAKGGRTLGVGRGALQLALIELGLDCVPRVPLWSDYGCVRLLAEAELRSGARIAEGEAQCDRRLPSDEALSAGPLRCCSSALGNDS